MVAVVNKLLSHFGLQSFEVYNSLSNTLIKPNFFPGMPSMVGKYETIHSNLKRDTEAISI